MLCNFYLKNIRCYLSVDSEYFFTVLSAQYANLKEVIMLLIGCFHVVVVKTNERRHYPLPPPPPPPPN